MINFEHFEEGDLLEPECNSEEDESISASIDELSTDNEYNYGYICTNYPEDIRDECQIHP